MDSTEEPLPKRQKIEKDVLRVKMVSQMGFLPRRSSKFAAGYDLFSANNHVVPARGKAIISTEIAIAIPEGCYGRIAPRSSLAANHSIDVGAGVIDADYRGEVKVVLFNHSDDDFKIVPGDKIAQLILERIKTPDVQWVKSLEDTERGSGGFGSTGKNIVEQPI